MSEDRERVLTEIVEVGLKPILILITSPFDIPPCKLEVRQLKIMLQSIYY